MSKVPADWLSGKVSDFLVLQRGFDLTKKQALNGNIPVYSSSGLAYYHNEAKVKGPGVITGRKGSVGPVYFVEEDFWPHDTTLWVKDFKGNLPEYVKIFLHSMELSKYDEASSVPTLNRNNVHCVRCAFPPLPEQTKIVQILSTWDKAIATTEKLIGNSQHQKKALMQNLLTGAIKFQGFSQWKKDTLENIVGEIHGGGTPSREIIKYWSGDIPWVTVKDLIGNKIISAKEFISKSGLDNSSARLVPAGTVILCTRMAVGKAVIAECEVAINQDLKAIYPSENIISDYLHNWFIYRKEVIGKMGTGSTVKGVQISAIKSLIMSVPSSLKEQQKIAAVLTAADNEIELLQKKLAFLKQEKAALMQQLLTGKRRVKVEAA